MNWVVFFFNNSSTPLVFFLTFWFFLIERGLNFLLIFVLESKSDNLTLFNGRKLTGTNIRHMIKKTLTLYFTRQDIYFDHCSVCSSMYDIRLWKKHDPFLKLYWVDSDSRDKIFWNERFLFYWFFLKASPYNWLNIILSTNILLRKYILNINKTTKHLIVYTTMTSKVYAYLNKRLTPIILR